MKKSTSILRLLLAVSFAAGLIAPAMAQRGYRGDYARERYRNDYRSVYRGYSRGYQNYRYASPVIIRPHYSPVFFGPRYYGVPHGSISITFGGNPYYYSGGRFYRPSGGYFQMTIPPVGIRIGMLPAGYIPIYVGPNEYYFYNGTYYRQYDDRNYEVIDAPMGAQLSSLPGGAKSVLVNGEKFYELNGTYYKEDRDSKGRVVYTVVGKNGEIDNTDETPASPPSAPGVGDKIAQLPSNCKSIILNGEKLYVSPNDTYYRAESDGNFTIVGIANQATL